MCIPLSQSPAPPGGASPLAIPLGTGMAGSARLTIAKRKQTIDEAVKAAGG